MALDIERKIDDDLTSKGKHYAREINLVTDTLNTLITKFGDQDPTSNTSQLLSAIASLQADIVFKGSIQTRTDPNVITLKSLASWSLKKYGQIGSAIFYLDGTNTGPVEIRIGNAPAKELLYDGKPVEPYKLKRNALYHVNLSGDEAILRDSAEPINPKEVLTIITDFDMSKDISLITGTGLYIYTAIHGSAHLPSNNEGHLLVINHGLNHNIYQVYTDIVTGNVYARSHVDGVWSRWSLTSRTNILYKDAGDTNHVIINANQITVYDARSSLMFLPNKENTGPTTININGVGEKDLYYNGMPLHDKTLIPGEVYLVKHNSYADRFDLYMLTIDQKLRDEFVGRTSALSVDLQQAVSDISDVRSSISQLSTLVDANASRIIALENTLKASVSALYSSIEALERVVNNLTDKINDAG